MASSAAAYLAANERAWSDVFDRLRERFPSVAPERVVEALRNHEGHAGSAAAELRDLTSVSVKPPDPDDAEHVATLLSSPMMFKHACKEHFAKCDLNGDGVLDFSEVVTLTNTLYFNFGLQQPSQGCLEAFFKATDENGDGVLSEREFRRFFEMFLRYAFFDVVKLQQLVDKQQAEGTGPVAPVRAAAQRPVLKVDDVYRQSEQVGAREQPAPQQPVQATPSRDRRSIKRDERKSSSSTTFVCVTPSGLNYCAGPDLADQTQHCVSQGESVQVLEHWVRTPNGWLPMHDSSGAAVLEKLQSRKAPRADDRAEAVPAKEQRVPKQNEARPEPCSPSRAAETPAAAKAKEMTNVASPQRSRASNSWVGGGDAKAKAAAPVEESVAVPEEWKAVVERLSERFPNAGTAKVVRALQDNAGHAGKAAAQLR